MRIGLAVGGTGGHILPALELAKQLREEGKEVHLIGVYLQNNPYLDKEFPYGSVVGSNRCLARMIRGIWQSLVYFRKHKISFVIGFGSYHSFPPLVAAILLRIPYSLYEANLIPGKVNRFFSRMAKWTAVQFVEAEKYLFSPVKQTDFLCAKFRRLTTSKQQAATYFSLSEEMPTVLVMGGSQGASSINQKIIDLLPSWQGRVQVIHFIGKKGDKLSIEALYEKWGIPHVVKPFEENMHHAYTLATFAIARAGAATLAELIHFQVPALLIPYPLASDNHQVINGRYFADIVQGGICLEETDWHLLIDKVEHFFNPQFLQEKRVSYDAFYRHWRHRDECTSVDCTREGI